MAISTKSTSETRADAPAPRLVWDWPVRLAHWLLVACVAGSWATHYAGAEWFAWHARCGYTVLVLVAFRITWGFAGTQHARFASFVRGPRRVLEYVRSGGQRTAGHNPLGALSVVAMLALLLAQAATGLFANDEIASSGPFYGWIAPATSHRITSLHHLNSDGLLALLVLHVAAVLWYAFARGHPIVRAMISGRKAASDLRPGESIESSRGWLAIAIVAVLVGLLALAIHAAPESVIALY
jgi:cytochrome b